MAELGELESHHAEFERRKTHVVAISVEGPEEAKKTQAECPHLIVVADEGRGLSSVADVIHARSAPDGGDTASPATLLVDRNGVVQWEYRPERFVTRLSADELLAAIDKHLPGDR
jgi:peroxiredoxin